LLHLEEGSAPLAQAGVSAASAPVTLELAPLLTSVSVSGLEPQGEGVVTSTPRYRGKLELVVEPAPKNGQNVGVLLNRSSAESHAFPVQAERGKWVAPFQGVSSGRYLVRVEVDGVASALTPQNGQPFTSPSVQIVPRRFRHG
jgi:hypothetical protein